MNKRATISTQAAAAAGLLLIFPYGAMAQQWSGSGPLPRYSHSAVLDPNTNKMIIFGGVLTQLNGQGLDLADLWWLNNTGGVNQSWTRVQASGPRPSARSGQSAIYDSSSNRMVMFGGGLGLASPCVSEVWTLADANGVSGTPTWTQTSTAGGPPPVRLRHTAVYDPTTNSMIIYGGNDCFHTNYGDVWVLANANGLTGTPTWTQLFPSGALPGGNEDASAVYDPGSNRMVLYTGAAGSNLWVLTNANGTGGAPVWLQLSPSGGGPSVRNGMSASYDSVNNIMTVFGGQNATIGYNDTWTLSNANGLGVSAWTQLEPTLRTGPVPRTGHSAVYNPTTNKMTIFGGIGTPPGVPANSVYLADVWTINHANGR